MKNIFHKNGVLSPLILVRGIKNGKHIIKLKN